VFASQVGVLRKVKTGTNRTEVVETDAKMHCACALLCLPQVGVLRQKIETDAKLHRQLMAASKREQSALERKVRHRSSCLHAHTLLVPHNHKTHTHA